MREGSLNGCKGAVLGVWIGRPFQVEYRVDGWKVVPLTGEPCRAVYNSYVCVAIEELKTRVDLVHDQ